MLDRDKKYLSAMSLERVHTSLRENQLPNSCKTVKCPAGRSNSCQILAYTELIVSKMPGGMSHLDLTHTSDCNC